LEVEHPDLSGGSIRQMAEEGFLNLIAAVYLRHTEKRSLFLQD